MSNPLRSLVDYEHFVHTLMQQFPAVRRSTVTFVKHVPPDIKHHRIPAPDMSFTRPNLPVLIREVEALMKRLPPEGEPKQV